MVCEVTVPGPVGVVCGCSMVQSDCLVLWVWFVGVAWYEVTVSGPVGVVWFVGVAWCEVTVSGPVGVAWFVGVAWCEVTVSGPVGVVCGCVMV